MIENPESGTINYGYDPNGNLTSKTDARGVKTDYIYDALNRVTNRNYSLVGSTPPNYQASPDVIYTYDNLPNAKGKLTKVTTGTGATPLSVTEYQEFDLLGRVTQSQQWVEGTAYGVPMTYTYNLSGALIEQKYPSGRIVNNTLDQNGDLQQVQSQKSGGTLQNYANAFTYTAAGAVSAMRLGNGKWETTQFNSRLQPTQIGLGAGASSQNLLKLNYTYNTSGNADNNGNVLSQTITVPTVGANQGFTATQNYTYDSLNRIKDAVEVIGTGETWRQTFLYDRYGNRTFDTTANRTTTIPAGCPTAVCNPSVDPATNKLVGYQFDNSGNTKVDVNGQVFTYDSENKQVEVRNASSAVLGQYFYDGDGKRVKTIVPSTGETTIFVYDSMGRSVAEYSTIVASSNDAKISYLTNDHLGSPRMTTDAVGQVISRRDFRPFGEEISRTNYGTDSIRQKFTTYERDNETNLDYAKARMFGYSFGRFTSPDPLMASGKRAVPQSWNRYTYVLNNPLTFTDPTGLIWGRKTIGPGRYEYHWFPGNKVGKGWDACTGDCLILENPTLNGRSLGYAIRLNPNGNNWQRIIPIDVPGAPRQWLSPKDAEAINAITGGALCSLSAGFVCPNKGEEIADNVQTAVDAAQYVLLIKSLIKLGLSLPTIAAIIKKSPEEVGSIIEKVSSGAIKGISKDFFEGTKYSNKVLGQIKKGDFHAFPESVKVFQGDGVVTTITGGDRITREMLKIPGSYKGKQGVFEFIKEADGTINHRYFRPDP